MEKLKIKIGPQGYGDPIAEGKHRFVSRV